MQALYTYPPTQCLKTKRDRVIFAFTKLRWIGIGETCECPLDTVIPWKQQANNGHLLLKNKGEQDGYGGGYI